MDYKEIWNDVCFSIDKNRNDLEQDFQKYVEFLFERLGWSQRKGEIITQKVIPVGAAKSLEPDIIIKNNDQEIFVIELKRPNNTLTEKNVRQLTSYMRQLRLDFGILLGETIQLYYDLPNDNKSPIQINDIPFEEDLVKGADFIKLLSKEEYSFDGLKKYCTDFLANEEKRKISQEKVDFLCSNEGTEFVKNLIKEKYLVDFSEEIVSSIIDKIEISIEHVSKKIPCNTNSQMHSSDFQDDNKGKRLSMPRDKAKQLCKTSGICLNKNLTISTTNSATKKYWANPQVDNLSQDWWLLLNDDNKKLLHVFFIPANSVSGNQFKFKNENLIDLQINYDDKSFEDSRSGVKFEKWLIKSISY